ncbi:hypothetical protein N8633_00585 [bacterium]|nr:hypothetical protein [Verrucomicrobiota bacterium]MDA7645748.1 hypothetical protein [bacterium]MDA7680261.1 hypothetical protein [bacterium]
MHFHEENTTILHAKFVPPVLTEQSKNRLSPIQTKRTLPWVIAGPIVTFVGVVSYFLVFAQSPALRDIPWLNIPLVLLGCAISIRGLVNAFQQRRRWIQCLFSVSGLLLSIGLTGLFLTYIGYLSYQMPAPTESNAGINTLPQFTSTDQSGSVFNSADLAGSNLILVFYRGHW